MSLRVQYDDGTETTIQLSCRNCGEQCNDNELYANITFSEEWVCEPCARTLHEEYNFVTKKVTNLKSRLKWRVFWRM